MPSVGRNSSDLGNSHNSLVSDEEALATVSGSGSGRTTGGGNGRNLDALQSDGGEIAVPQGTKADLKYLPHTMYNFTLRPSYQAEDGTRRLVRVGVGAWYTAAFHVATTIATPPAFASLPFAMAALGWDAGAVMLVASTLISWYSSILVASLWEFDGKKHTSYRDLMRAIFGKPGYWSVVVFQQVASLGNNISIQIAAGLSMKAVYNVHSSDNTFTLQEFIVLFGLVELALSQLPDIHSLRLVNLVCMVCTVGFAAIAFGMSLHNGKMLDRSTVDYNLHGSKPTQVFGIFRALGTVAFSFGDAMLPEIQSTVKEPARRNMYRGASLAYTVIVLCYWSVTFVGYWAFGSSVEGFILSSLTTPTWPIVMANIFTIIQILGCYQIYCRPTYDFVLDKVMDPRQGPYAVRNGLGRLFVTATYIVVVTLVAAAMPFLVDFVALCGAIGFTPLDFILPVLAYLAVRKPRNVVTVGFNLGIAAVFSIVAVLGAVGAARFIVTDIGTYKFFTDI